MKIQKRVFIQSPKIFGDDVIESGKIIIRVRWNNKKNEVGFYSGYYGNPSKWNDVNQRPKPSTSHIRGSNKVSSSQINDVIREYDEAIDRAANFFELNEKIPTTAELKQKVYEFIGLSDEDILKRKAHAHEDTSFLKKKIEEDNKSFFDWLETFIDEGQNILFWKRATVKKFITILNNLKEYDDKLSFDELDTYKMLDIQKFLVEKGYRNVSIQDTFKRLRWFFRWCAARKKPLITDNAIIGFRSKLKDVEHKTVVFLDWDEFQKLCNCSIPPSRKGLERVRDIFIMQCTTGLRYSDVYNLKRYQIVNDAINLVTKKTCDTLIIKLNKYSRGVLEKYKDFHFKDDKALPAISNQKMNKYLKELCEFAQIDTPTTISYRVGNKLFRETKPKYELMGSHCGRRTFVSIAASLGCSMEEIARITGHHSYKVMQRYIGLNDKQKQHATSVFDERSERDNIMAEIDKLSNAELIELLKKK